MLYYILISIVFIAELVITITIISHLCKWGKLFRTYNAVLEESKEDIRSLLSTCRKISEQLTELAPLWVENIKSAFIDIIIKNAKTTLIGILVWAIKQKIKQD